MATVSPPRMHLRKAIGFRLPTDYNEGCLGRLAAGTVPVLFLLVIPTEGFSPSGGTCCSDFLSSLLGLQGTKTGVPRSSPVLARAEQLTTRAVSPSQILQVTHITGAGDKTHGPPGRENPIVDTYSRAEFRKSGGGQQQ